MPSEFELIDRYFTGMGSRADVLTGVGDDAAVVALCDDTELAVTVDTLLEGVHFHPGADPYALGHKALAVSLSDLAAMGAEPTWVTLALTLPAPDETWLSGFSRGFDALAQRYDVQLIGGDTTRGPLSITVQAMGRIPSETALKRDGARDGDLIYVTGTLGDAALGLATLAQGVTLSDEDRHYCLERLHRPEPRVQAGMALRRIASAAIDLSDGLVGDLKHMLSASQVGAKLLLDDLPLSEAFRRAHGGQIDWSLALSGGDDYELLFTVPQFAWARAEHRLADLACHATCIGLIEQEPGLRLKFKDESEYNLVSDGYDHFK